MNVDRQLRSALGHEAEIQNVPAPDVDRLISGGRARQRRRTIARLFWVAIATAAALLVAAWVYGAAKNGPGTTVEPARASLQWDQQTHWSHGSGSSGPKTVASPSCASPQVARRQAGGSAAPVTA